MPAPRCATAHPRLARSASRSPGHAVAPAPTTRPASRRGRRGRGCLEKVPQLMRRHQTGQPPRCHRGCAPETPYPIEINARHDPGAGLVQHGEAEREWRVRVGRWRGRRQQTQRQAILSQRRVAGGRPRRRAWRTARLSHLEPSVAEQPLDGRQYQVQVGRGQRRVVEDADSQGSTWYDAFAKPDLVGPGHKLVATIAKTSTLATDHPDAIVAAHSSGVPMASTCG